MDLKLLPTFPENNEFCVTMISCQIVVCMAAIQMKYYHNINSLGWIIHMETWGVYWYGS